MIISVVKARKSYECDRCGGVIPCASHYSYSHTTRYTVAVIFRYCQACIPIETPSASERKRRKECHQRPSSAWGSFVFDLRSTRRMTRRELAEIVGVHPSYVTLWEKGRSPRRNIVLRFAEVVGVSKDEALLRAGYYPAAARNVTKNSTSAVEAQKAG